MPARPEHENLPPPMTVVRRDRRRHGVRLAVGLAWQATQRRLFFVEARADSASSHVRNAGLRWWGLPDATGLGLGRCGIKLPR